MADVTTPTSRRPRLRRHRPIAALGLAVLLAAGNLVLLPVAARAAVPEVRTPLPRVAYPYAFSGVFVASGSTVVAGTYRSDDAGTSWSDSGLPREQLLLTNLDMYVAGGHLVGYTRATTSGSAYHATDYALASGTFSVSQSDLPGMPISMSADWMLYRDSQGNVLAYDVAHAAAPVPLHQPSTAGVTFTLPRLTPANGILWTGTSSTGAPVVAFATTPGGTPGDGVVLDPGRFTVVSVDTTTLRYALAAASGLRLCTLPLADLTATPHCIAADSADDSGFTVVGRTYGSWSLVALTSSSATSTTLFAWAGDTTTRVTIPGVLTAAQISSGDVALVAPTGATTLSEISATGSVSSRGVWPTKTILVDKLALAPDRVVLTGGASLGDANTVWSQSVSAGGFGSLTRLPKTASLLAVTAARTVTVGPDGTAVYDRGLMTATMDPTSGPLDASGPYVTLGWRSSPYLANGLALPDTQYAGTRIFGSQAVAGSATSTTPFHLSIEDLTGSAPVRYVDLAPTGFCRTFYVWADLFAPACDDHTLRVFSLSTGMLVASRGTSGVDELDPLAVGDGYVVMFDYRTQTNGVWNLSDNTVTTLAGCARQDVATDGAGHIVCASTTELIWRDFSSIASSPGRVLGWLAPTRVTSGGWLPQVDVTKAFGAGTLRILHGSSVVREIPVPASQDGSLRGVLWDGKTTSGEPAPPGTYTAQLVVSGLDGSGPVKALDGTSAPTFQLDVVAPGQYVPLTPTRLLDTRVESGGAGPMGPYEVVQLTVAGRGGVPQIDVAAVVLNVTAVTPKGSGHLTVYPTGVVTPTASNLNYTAGQIVPNLVVAKVGMYGQVSIFNGSPNTTELVVDVAGFIVAGTATTPGALVPMTPWRALETREVLGGSGPLASYETVKVQVAGRSGVPASGVSAAIVNLTTVDASMSGYLTAYPTGTTAPTASNVNFLAGQTVANLAFVKLDADGSFTIVNGSGGTTHVVADVAGYVREGTPTGPGMFVPLSPSRILETRPGYGGSGPVPAMTATSLTVAGAGGVPPTGVSGVVMNTTAVAGGSPGYLTVYPGDAWRRPWASNLNVSPYQTVPNLVAVKTSATGAVSIYNGTASPVELVVDVSGYFTA